MVEQANKIWHAAVESGDLQKRNLPIKPDVQDYKSPALKNEIGSRISYLLRVYNLTQSELAERLGTSAPYLNRVISGGALIGTELLARLGDILDVNIDWILTGKGSLERTASEELPSNVYNTTLLYSILAKAVAEGSEDAQLFTHWVMGDRYQKILKEKAPHIEIFSVDKNVKRNTFSGQPFAQYLIWDSKIPSLTQEVYNSTYHINDGNERCKAVFELALTKLLDNYESPIVSEYYSGMMQRYNMS